MSKIPIFYESDDPDGERDYIRELRTWLVPQPHDAWLIFVKNMNWDSMDSVTQFMIDDPECDIAVIAWIFWTNDPAWHIANSDKRSEGRAANDRILANLARGFYARGALALNRVELLDGVLRYAEAVRSRRAAGRPLVFTLARPAARRLLGPFTGREPAIAPGDAATEAHLDEIVEGLGGSYLYRTQAAWRDAYESNYWIRHYFALPEAKSATDLVCLEELAHIEALYGSTDAYRAACITLNADMPYAGKPTAPSILGRLRWLTRNLRGNDQLYRGP